MPLQAVETRRLYRQIADQLRALIAAGEFVPGSRLPPESIRPSAPHRCRP